MDKPTLLRTHLDWSEERGLYRKATGESIAVKPNSRGYTVFQVCQGPGWRYRELYHRAVFFFLNGWLPELVDHKDRCKSNHQPDNLRAATGSQNQYNKVTSKASSLPRGVFVAKSKRFPFYAQARGAGGRHRYLGKFETPEAASAVVEAFLKTIHGEFYHSQAD